MHHALLPAELARLKAPPMLIVMHGIVFWAVSFIWVIQGARCESIEPQNVPAYEIAALQDLYQSTGGSSWIWQGNGTQWNFTDPNPCADYWIGVTCTSNATAQNLNVLKLELSKFNMQGTVPPSIANLTKLQFLDLYENSLYGEVPNEIGQLIDLQVLFLGYNLFSEQLPDSFSMLQNLQRIRIGQTYMTGSFPEVLCQLPRLTHIAIKNSNFNGTLPACYGVLNLTALEMSGNLQLRGTIPQSLGNLHHLQLLDLFFTSLTGSIPSFITNFTRLVLLDLSTNAFTGSLPGNWEAMQSLEVLQLTYCGINGTIPSALLSLPALRVCEVSANKLTGPLVLSDISGSPLELLGVSSNQLSGSIAATLGGYTQLRRVSLDNNVFTGSLPGTIERCTQLRFFDASYNNFTGVIPGGIGFWTPLSSLILSNNRFSGTIPASIKDCTSLLHLDVSHNNLTGSIPDVLGECGQLTLLDLSFNQLSGSIPTAFTTFFQLHALYLTSNRLTGTIPDTAGGYSTLELFNVSDNQLTGSIPASLFDSGAVYLVDVGDNQLTGTFPAGALTAVSLLLCGGNHLTGTLPSGAGTEARLTVLNMTGNSLSGSISASFVEAIRGIVLLFLDKNRLTGALPDAWSASAGELQFLYLNENELSGTLPASLGQLSALKSLNLSNNRLSGEIPTSFQQLGALKVLMLQNNQLRGNIVQVFDAFTQELLTTVQLSGNRLTGTIPASVFALPQLSSFAAVGTCFDGPLPEDAICSSASLYALVLDGLNSATTCRRSSSLSSSAFKLGTLPLCLLSMANLTTLHLSGSGLTGSLPADLTVSTTLSDLSLSHNLLSGKIPGTFLSRNWAKLDLSYNRLVGTLHGAQETPYDASTQLFLQHNRLSGVIPRSMHAVGSLSILENNMFSCLADRSDVPAQDGDSDKYTCGSDAVNNALYVWIGVVVTCIVVVCAMYYRGAVPASIWEWLHVADMKTADGALRLPGLKHVACVSHGLCVLGAASAAYCIVVLMPVFAGAGSLRMYTYQYAWTLSGAFLSGKVAFALQATFLLLLLVLWSAGYTALPRLIIRDPGARPREETPHLIEAATAQKALVYTVYLLCNMSIVVGVNVAFVIASLNLDGRALAVVQILLAVFKLTFNSVVAPEWQRSVRGRLARGGRDLTHEFSSVQLFVALFNNVAIPCLVVMLISPSCFYDALKGSDRVTSSYVYSGTCTGFNNIPFGGQYCYAEALAIDSTSFEAPFAYSYMCSSSFVTYYAPTFVAMCVISGFMIPASRLLMVRLLHRLPRTSQLHALVSAYTPRSLKELRSPEAVAKSRADPSARPLFDANQLMITLWTYLALLLTFGAMFPPLALCCAVAMASIASLALLSVGRYVAAADAAGRADCVEQVAHSCAGAASPQQLRVALDMVLTVSCLFYTLFLFDTLGDAVDFDGAYWVLIFMPLLPVSLLSLRSALFAWGARSTNGIKVAKAAAPEGSAIHQAAVELTDIKSIEDGTHAAAENPMHDG